MAILMPGDDETEDSENLTLDAPIEAPTQKREPKPMMPPLRCRVVEAAHAVRVSPRHLINRINNGELPTVRDGSGRYVLISELIKYAKKDHPIPPPKKSPKKRVRDDEDGAC